MTDPIAEAMAAAVADPEMALTNVTPTLALAMRDVREFHRVFDHPMSDMPISQTPFLRDRRADFIQSEVEELRLAGTDLVEQADAYIDILYFAFGGLVEMGLDPSPLWNIVHGANMAKVGPDGRVIKDLVTGKALKPEGWQNPGPLLRAEIARQIGAAVGA